MNIVKSAIISVLLVFSVAVNAFEKGEVALDFSSLYTMSHPRLMMDEDDFENLRGRLQEQGNESLKKMNEIILSNAERLLKNASPLEYKLDVSGKRILHVSREALLRITSSAYAYRMTGDKRFLDFAQAQMDRVCSFTDWNPNHFLDVGEMALAVSIGYDWLYDDLSPQIRSKAEETLNAYAMEPALAKKAPWFYDAMNNWNQVCNGGLVATAASLCDKYPEESEAIIRKAVNSNKAPMEKMYSPDGNYGEGYSYWMYGTAYEVIMLKILEDSFGTDFGLSKIPGFLDTADYMLFMEGVRGCFNYSDCGTLRAPAIAMWYFAEKLQRPQLLFNELRALEDGLYSRFSDDRLLPLIISFAAKVDLDNVEHPEDTYWYGEGTNPVALVRKDWTGSSSDAYLAVKAGMAYNNHGHMDAGSFVYDAYGERWSMDLGLQSYAPLEKAAATEGGNIWNKEQDSWRWKVLRYNNLYHSTITIDDAHHNVKGVGNVKEFINKEEEKGMLLDMSEVLKGQVKSAERKVVMLEDGSLEVTDRIDAPEDRNITFTWRMVTGAAPEVKKNCIVLTSGEEKMRLKAFSDVDFEYCTWSAEPVNTWDAPNMGVSVVGIEAVIEKGQSAYFVVKLKRKG